MTPANQALLEVITVRHHAAEIVKLHKALDAIRELDSGRAQAIAAKAQAK